MSVKSTDPAVQPAAPERRRSARKSNVGKAWIASPTARSESERQTVTGVNISRHGVCFAIDIELPEDAYYLIDVMMGTQKLNAEIQIVSCRKQGNGYAIGAEFC